MLNEFAAGLDPQDLAATDEFKSLLQSATELRIPYDPAVRYVSRQTVMRGMRFHFTEFGDPGAPDVLTATYNLLVRADGKYVSKADHRRMRRHVEQVTLDQVRHLACPVLIVRGGKSEILPADAAERSPTPCRRGGVTVPDVGHNVHGGNTAGFLAAVGAFLDEVHRPDAHRDRRRAHRARPAERRRSRGPPPVDRRARCGTGGADR